MSVEWDYSRSTTLFRSLTETRITDAGVKTLHPAVAAHPAIKSLVYGYSGDFLLP